MSWATPSHGADENLIEVSVGDKWFCLEKSPTTFHLYFWSRKVRIQYQNPNEEVRFLERTREKKTTQNPLKTTKEQTVQRASCSTLSSFIVREECFMVLTLKKSHCQIALGMISKKLRYGRQIDGIVSEYMHRGGCTERFRRRRYGCCCCSGRNTNRRYGSSLQCFYKRESLSTSLRTNGSVPTC